MLVGMISQLGANPVAAITTRACIDSLQRVDELVPGVTSRAGAASDLGRGPHSPRSIEWPRGTNGTNGLVFTVAPTVFDSLLLIDSSSMATLAPRLKASSAQGDDGLHSSWVVVEWLLGMHLPVVPPVLLLAPRAHFDSLLLVLLEEPPPVESELQSDAFAPLFALLLVLGRVPVAVAATNYSLAARFLRLLLATIHARSVRPPLGRRSVSFFLFGRPPRRR